MINPIDLTTERQSVLNYLKTQLVGPVGGENEILVGEDTPDGRYLTGILFPREIDSTDHEIKDWQESSNSDDTVTLAYQPRPASCGLSFFTNATEITVSISGGYYQPKVGIPTTLEETSDNPEEDIKAEGGKKESCKYLKRIPLASLENPEVHQLSQLNPEILLVLNKKASLRSKWRKLGNGHLVTVSLVNNATVEKNERGRNPEDMITQVWLECSPSNGKIESYPSPTRYSWDKEEEELALTYESKKTYAIGHGTSALWDTDSKKVSSVRTSFVPHYEVPPITAEFDQSSALYGSDVFSLKYLSDPDTPFQEKTNNLDDFVNDYEKWIAHQVDMAESIGKYPEAASRIIERLKLAKERMKKGIRFLSDNSQARECFELANKAMLLQMIHSGHQFGGSQKDKGGHFPTADYSLGEWNKMKWRPFQLAFQLLTIESLANRNSIDRDTVDLIWFPTGGGKTEAYLSIAAFELFWRRMVYGDAGGGTAVIKRYTLRLLTSQQFQRVSTLICACEHLRKSKEEDFGSEPFSLGLWVGGDTSPNDFQTARALFSEVTNEVSPTNPFQLLNCPWCGCKIIPTRRQEDMSHYGIRCDDSFFEFYCPNDSCEFHDSLPVNVVDEQLYKTPPSFLVGTIDKFARLPWIDNPRAFFCGGNLGERQPPSLIIQDELHLISGPLGTVAGLYEAALDVVMQSAGARPKYIAATATIRRAAEQVKRLYARDVAVFPPSGISVTDSYYSKEVKGKPGRLYAGILSPHQSPVFSLAGTAAALAQAPMELNLSEEAKNGYWSQVIFHNSRRELGKTMTLARDDIPKRAEFIATENSKVRPSTEPIEMSANIPSKEIPVVLDLLNKRWDSPDSVNILPCTNMLSVGVDVQRLGLILMNGQPKTTAEYIQASSRVGRGKVPGLVVAFYPNNKSRDRSHYESFLPYHQALYRAVEPTSVTPYAQPAMERAMHAAIIIVMRYAGGCSGNSGAQKFNKTEPHTHTLLQRILSRMLAAEGLTQAEGNFIENYFNLCVSTWHERAHAGGRSRQKLAYDTGRQGRNFEPLMTNYRPGMPAKPGIPWATLNSMRNVDQECEIHVMGENNA